jgi:hypothetical protein
MSSLCTVTGRSFYLLLEKVTLPFQKILIWKLGSNTDGSQRQEFGGFVEKIYYLQKDLSGIGDGKTYLGQKQGISQ